TLPPRAAWVASSPPMRAANHEPRRRRTAKNEITRFVHLMAPNPAISKLRSTAISTHVQTVTRFSRATKKFQTLDPHFAQIENNEGFGYGWVGSEKLPWPARAAGQGVDHASRAPNNQTKRSGNFDRA